MRQLYVTETTPIIYSVVTVTMTAGSGNSQLAALAHGEHAILSVAGEAPSTPWSVMTMSFLSSIPTEILGSASSSASTVSATSGNAFWSTTSPYNSTVTYMSTSSKKPIGTTLISYNGYFPRSCRTSRHLFLSPSWPGGPALRQLRLASLQQPPFPPTSPAPVTHPAFHRSRAQNPTSDSRRPCSLPSVRETGYARARPQ